jgi:Clp amino terminal domain, pathogenicity island component
MRFACGNIILRHDVTNKMALEQLHLLLALIDDQDAAAGMTTCNVDLDKLRRNIVASISELENLVTDGNSKLTAGFQRSRPKRLHLDRRAPTLAAVEGDDDELLTTQQEADWLGVSPQWLEIGRVRGYGPPFERLGPKIIRYSRGKTRRWLNERTHLRTDEYLGLEETT